MYTDTELLYITYTEIEQSYVIYTAVVILHYVYTRLCIEKVPWFDMPVSLSCVRRTRLRP
jgi:hypothetical protein